MLNRIIKYFLDNRVITLLLLVIIIVWGLSTAPFNWHGGVLPRDPVPVDAIPDIGKISKLSPPNGWDVHLKIFRNKLRIRYLLHYWGYPE